VAAAVAVAVAAQQKEERSDRTTKAGALRWSCSRSCCRRTATGAHRQERAAAILSQTSSSQGQLRLAPRRRAQPRSLAPAPVVQCTYTSAPNIHPRLRAVESAARAARAAAAAMVMAAAAAVRAQRTCSHTNNMSCCRACTARTRTPPQMMHTCHHTRCSGSMSSLADSVAMDAPLVRAADSAAAVAKVGLAAALERTSTC
jgi:hypothetical protein